MKKIMFNDRYGLTQAVIEGQKTVTRRIMNRQPDPDDIAYMEPKDYPCQPPYKVGEIVAVAQCYADIHSELMIGDFGDDCYDSFKNAVVHDKAGWHNKMFVQADLMPHQIRITSVRPERLQDITDEDCLKEGLEWQHGANMFYVNYNRTNNSRELLGDTPREAFASLMDKISGRGTWERNPFVWRIEFKLVK
jgi:hypothetical protein